MKSHIINKKLSCRRETERCFVIEYFVTQGQSGSLERAPFGRSRTSFYWRFIIIVALSCVVFEIKRDIGLVEKNDIFIPACIRRLRQMGPRRSIAITFGTRIMWLPDDEK